MSRKGAVLRKMIIIGSVLSVLGFAVCAYLALPNLRRDLPASARDIRYEVIDMFPDSGSIEVLSAYVDHSGFEEFSEARHLLPQGEHGGTGLSANVLKEFWSYGSIVDWWPRPAESMSFRVRITADDFEVAGFDGQRIYVVKAAGIEKQN